MTIGIMGAMPEEVAILKNHISNLQTTKIGDREFYHGQINNKDVVLAFSRWGKVAAATTTSILIHIFNVDNIIFTGVAGGLHHQLSIGDIIISNNLYQHDLNSEPLFPRYEIPLTGKTYISADNKLINKAQQSTHDFIHNIDKYINTNILNEFDISSPKYYIGQIASGDLFINNTTYIEDLLNNNPDTLAVEMEGAAVAQVCEEHNVPFVVIRVISDLARDNSHIDFEKFIAKVAQFYCEQIVLRIV